MTDQTTNEYNSDDSNTVQFWITMFRPRKEKDLRKMLKKLKQSVSPFETFTANQNKQEAIRRILN